MVQSVDIPVFDNIEFGGNKVFSVVAELVSFGERVRIDPTVAMTTIVENELAPQGEINIPLELHSLIANKYVYVTIILLHTHACTHMHTHTLTHTHTHTHTYTHTHTHTHPI